MTRGGSFPGTARRINTLRLALLSMAHAFEGLSVMSARHYTGMGDRQISRHLANLTGDGLLMPIKLGDGQGRPRLYMLTQYGRAVLIDRAAVMISSGATEAL